MNKNVLLYSGSRTIHSRPNKIISRLNDHIASTYDDVNVLKFNPMENPLRHSTGCVNCFVNGFCPSDSLEDDHGSRLKDYVDKANFIIFATPVYSHNVSSDAKIFIDRLSYWGHLMKLLEKQVMIIITCESNGGEFVDDYLHKVFSFMGADIVHSEIFNRSYHEEYEDQIEEIIDVFDDSYANNFKAEVTKSHEATFQTLKSIIRNYPEDNFEFRYWRDNGLLASEDVNEYLTNRKYNLGGV